MTIPVLEAVKSENPQCTQGYLDTSSTKAGTRRWSRISEIGGIVQQLLDIPLSAAGGTTQKVS